MHRVYAIYVARELAVMQLYYERVAMTKIIRQPLHVSNLQLEHKIVQSMSDQFGRRGIKMAVGSHLHQNRCTLGQNGLAVVTRLD